MSFANRSNDKNLIERITKAIRNNHISHAYILEGDLCCDKMGFARDLVKAIICSQEPGVGCDRCSICHKIQNDNYDDLFLLEANGTSVKNDNIISLQSFLKRKPTAGDRNIAIIQNADEMTVRAQNRLLKTLEEPNPGTIIILLSENSEKLLDTIRSRCIIYRLYSMEDDGEKDAMEVAEGLIGLLLEEDYFYRAKKIVDKEIKSKEDAFVVLDAMERRYRDYMLQVTLESKLYKREKSFEAIEYIEQAKRDLQINVNYSYAFKNMLIKIGG